MKKRGRFRITVRDLIVLVASAAVLMAVMPSVQSWFVATRDQWRLYKLRADAFERIEAGALQRALNYEDPTWKLVQGSSAYRAEMARYFRECSAISGQLKRKYHRALLHPWVPVPPDPSFPRMPLNEGETYEDDKTVEIK
jgi:hypothetical protein